MSGVLEDASARAPIALAATVGAVLSILLPSLLTPTSVAAGSVTLAVLALGLAALVRFGIRCGALTVRTKAVPSTTAQAPPVLPGRTTDPVHQPLRPRAPGLT